jgi:hypothetical protein
MLATLVDALQGSLGLIALDHAVNFFDLAGHIAAAELQLFAATAGTHRVGINRHGLPPSIGLEIARSFS